MPELALAAYLVYLALAFGLRIDFRFGAPDRYSFRSDTGLGGVTIGRRDWSLTDSGRWRRIRDGSGSGFRIRQWFDWTRYARSARLLGVRTHARRWVARLALFDPSTPAWHLIDVDLASGRLPLALMAGGDHFMVQRFAAFNRPISVRAPRSGG